MADEEGGVNNHDGRPASAMRAFDAMMQMKISGIAAIEAARRGSGVFKECLNDEFDPRVCPAAEN